MKKTLAGIGIGLVAIMTVAALSFAAVSVVSAQTPTPGKTTTAPTAGTPVRVIGKVTSTSASSIVLTTPNGDVTANISANTFIVVQKNGANAQGTASDIVTGQPAAVVGVATADPKVVDARLISQGEALGGRGGVLGGGQKPGPGAPGGPRGRGGFQRPGVALLDHAAAGTITAINGNTITLQGEKVAQVTVNTSANTLILNNGFSTLSSLKVGDKVDVLGSPERPTPGGQNGQPPALPGSGAQVPQSRTLDAWALRVDNGTSKLTIAHVASISGNTANVTAPKNGTGTTITFDANTQFKSLTITMSPAANSFTFSTASQADVQANSNIVVEGVASADGKSITAKSVIILPARGFK